MSWIPLLLADSSACLRWLVLRRLLQRADTDEEVSELSAMRNSDPLISSLIRSQLPDGSWEHALLPTSLALSRLGYLGFGADHPAVLRGAEFLFSRQQLDGSWPLSYGSIDGDRQTYSMIPLQTALPLRGLAACGFAVDFRAERAFDWLLAQRLPDGAWPTGIASGVFGGVAGYRKLPHSRWGCRSNTTGALTCLALHPTRCTGPEMHTALDLLLGRETRERFVLGYEVARVLGGEASRGFLTFYARFDLAHLLRLCALARVDVSDDRLTNILATIRDWQGEHGLWEYQPKPHLSRWLTFDILDALLHLENQSAETSAWISREPRTPFQTYPKKAKRF